MLLMFTSKKMEESNVEECGLTFVLLIGSSSYFFLLQETSARKQ